MSDLNAFLEGKAGGGAVSENDAGEPVADPRPEPAAPPPEPEGEAPEGPEGEAPPERQDGRTVPLAALEGERRQRQDWKDRAARAEAERDALNRQIEELRRAAPPPPPPEPLDPVQQPHAFIERVQQVVLNERLNSSEMALRREVGAEKVEAAVAEFQAAAKEDPALFGKLYAQVDPYGWMYQQVEALRLRREIGDDPAAYRARLRAEVEAELRGAGGVEPAAPGAPRMQPSLAGARSAAPRSAPVFTGPTPLEDLLRRG